MELSKIFLGPESLRSPLYSVMSHPENAGWVAGGSMSVLCAGLQRPTGPGRGWLVDMTHGKDGEARESASFQDCAPHDPAGLTTRKANTVPPEDTPCPWGRGAGCCNFFRNSGRPFGPGKKGLVGQVGLKRRETLHTKQQAPSQAQAVSCDVWGIPRG